MQNNMQFIRKLPIPMDVKEQYPLKAEYAELKKERDREIADIFTGKDDRLVLVIGPCSADHEDPVLDYISRLVKVQEKVKDRILIIPRIYTNKPRTTGDGYKGMLHQPDPDKKEDMLEGIISIRRLHTRAIEETGFFCADEMLYPENYRYLSDLLAYVAVGARSTENQQHRLVASGIDVPVGMKNPTGGDISVMLNSITAAQHSHTFLYRGWECVSSGNPLAHAILRGYVNKHGESIPNYHFEDLYGLYKDYSARNLQNIALIVDANHANSGKKYLEQERICKEVLHACRHSSEIKSMVKGFMIESYIEDGAQKIGEGVYGKSITDPCLGWEKTERLILDLAELSAL
ncbi:MAG: 3-deoxy-7-phosphoheptulonate synthase [Clostridia bacterium]|nr:3-deoxy-7-phosphoheptulonate synthase [Clostridia bacterium]